MNASLLIVLCFVTIANSFDASEDVYYELYTNDQPLTHFHNLLTIKNDNDRSEPIADSPFNHSLPTRIYVHGYRSKRKNFLKYAEAYRFKGNFNFIAVNWLEGARTINYYKARNRVEKVSTYLKHSIIMLINLFNSIDRCRVGTAH